MFDQLATDRAADAILVVELGDAAGAEGVAAVHKNTRNSLTNVVLHTAKLANVHATRFIIKLHDVHLGLHTVFLHLNY